MADNKKKKGIFNRKFSFLITLAIIAVCVTLVVSIVKLSGELDSVEKELNQVKTEQAAQEAENKQLEENLKSGDIDEYVEGVARDKLGYVKPGERVYYDVSVNN